MKQAREVTVGDSVLDTDGIWRVVMAWWEVEDKRVLLYEPKSGCSCGDELDPDTMMNVRKKR